MDRMRRALVTGGIALLMAVSPGAGAAKRAKVVDGIVAIVADRPILLSELRQRMAFARLDARPMLERIIDERVIERDGAGAEITVTPEDVDDAIRAGAVRVKGMSEQDYRDEVRRQLYEQKWIEVRLVPRLRAGTSLDVQKRARLDELRRELLVEVLQ